MVRKALAVLVVVGMFMVIFASSGSAAEVKTLVNTMVNTMQNNVTTAGRDVKINNFEMK